LFIEQSTKPTGESLRLAQVGQVVMELDKRFLSRIFGQVRSPSTAKA
jgi:hypothetical protein